MCGITACIALESYPARQLNSSEYRQRVTDELHCSLDTIQHRGPDARGTWISDDDHVALGHNRLSIKDLSTAGDQPMHNPERTVHIIVNGEFYNYDELRADLSKDWGYQFVGQSDSELLLALYERDGLNCFSSLRGEFSFVLYDETRQLLLLARDRYGVKPLFWTVCENRLLVASEAKAFRAYGWKAQWDVRSIVEDGWMHDQRTMFKGVRKLIPGHYMTCVSFEFMREQPFWETSYANKLAPEIRSEEEMTLGLRQQLYDAVKCRMQGDVPFGIYLSGGIDSAVVAGIAADIVRKQHSPSASKRLPLCFNVGFKQGTEFDETEYARNTAKFLDLPFFTQRLDEQTFADHFEETYVHCEHHNPDLNSVAKFVLSQLARDNGVKVIISGEGSDEHFGGYTQFVPDFVREPDLTWDGEGISEGRRRDLVVEKERQVMPGYKGFLEQHARVQSALARRMLNNTFISSCLWTVTVVPFAQWPRDRYGALSIQESRANNPGAKCLQLINRSWHPLHTAHYIWQRSILPNFILTSMGDRMEMSHSIEGRPAFLDHELTAYANHLPPALKIKLDPQTGEVREKHILREAAKPFITEEMYNRKKHPFSAPHIYKKMGPVHCLLMRLVTKENVQRLGFVDADKVLERLRDAFEGETNPDALRSVFIIAQWIVLSKAFDVAPAVGEQSRL